MATVSLLLTLLTKYPHPLSTHTSRALGGAGREGRQWEKQAVNDLRRLQNNYTYRTGLKARTRSTFACIMYVTVPTTAAAACNAATATDY